MARRFRGEFTQKVDGKGRVSIPSQFRTVLQQGDPGCLDGKTPEFVLVYGDDSFDWFECYSMEGIEEVDERIDAKPFESDEREYLEEMYHGHALTLTIDETGRIVLPLRQRQKIGLEDEAYFIASSNHFQIWKRETYDKVADARRKAWRERQSENFKARALLDKPAGA